MFSVGEYIVYGVEGVCRVEEAGKLKVAGLDKNRAYYRLRPYYHDGTIYTPVDGKAVMRPVLTARSWSGFFRACRSWSCWATCRPTAVRRASITAPFYPGTTALRSCACARRSMPSRTARRPATGASTRPSCAAGAWPRRCYTANSALRSECRPRRCGTSCAKSWADKAQRSARSASIYAGPVPQQPPSRLAPSCFSARICRAKSSGSI